MIETFTKEEFEYALSTMEKDVVPLGLLNFEYCYLILVTKQAAILVRSSVDWSKKSATVGEDSIRVYPGGIMPEMFADI